MQAAVDALENTMEYLKLENEQRGLFSLSKAVPSDQVVFPDAFAGKGGENEDLKVKKALEEEFGKVYKVVERLG